MNNYLRKLICFLNFRATNLLYCRYLKVGYINQEIHINNDIEKFTNNKTYYTANTSNLGIIKQQVDLYTNSETFRKNLLFYWYLKVGYCKPIDITN